MAPGLHDRLSPSSARWPTANRIFFIYVLIVSESDMRWCANVTTGYRVKEFSPHSYEQLSGKYTFIYNMAGDTIVNS